MDKMTEPTASQYQDSAYSSCSSPGDEHGKPLTSPEWQDLGWDMPTVQKAVVTPLMAESLNMEVQQVPVRPPSADESVVKIVYTGLCYSDASFSVGPKPGFPKHNHIAGHEGIGIVVDSANSSLVGRRAGIRYLGSSCGTCTYCIAKLHTSCPDQLNAPKHITGTFQEYATVPTSCLLLLPDDIPVERPDLLCSALCSGSTALKGLRAAEIGPQSVIVVSGIFGAIGHMAGSIARGVFGAKVIGIDLARKCSVMRERGFGDYADVLVDAPDSQAGDAAHDELVALLSKSCSQLRRDGSMARAADAAIICSSSASAFNRLEDLVCDGGRIVCVGVPYGHRIDISLNALVERNLHLTGNLMGDHLGALEVMRFIQSGLAKPLINEIGIDDIGRHLGDMVACQSIGKTVAKIAEDGRL